MQLSKTSEYAIRALVFLEKQKGIQKLEDIARDMDIPDGYLTKVLRILKRNHMVSAYQGSKGGYQLSKKGDELSLFDILSVTEKTIKINSCLCDEKCTLYGGTKRCRIGVYSIYCELQEIFEDKTKSITLRELASSVCEVRDEQVLRKN